jgi:ketosteroid isomerase-like protein
MANPEQTIRRFYDAFSRLDAATMQACYASDARFEDEVFTLNGAPDIGAMWGMLCSSTKANPKARETWRLTYRDVQADGTSGQAHWDAHYLFSATGRTVDNAIDARFGFTPEGLIASHRDSFDFWKWSRQALGAPGWLLGWSPSLRAKVRAKAAGNLARFRQQ